MLTILLLLLLRLTVLWLLLVSTIVACVALWVRGVVLAIHTTCLAVLEAALGRRAEGVLSSRWTEVLGAVAALLLTVLWLLWVGVGVRVALLLAVLRLLRVAAVAALVVV